MYKVYAIMEILEIKEDGMVNACYSNIYYNKKKADKECKELQAKEKIFFESNGEKLPKYSVITIS